MHTGREEEDNYDRMTDCAVNALYVLGFLSCGDGGKEAGRILGLLDLPNSTTMESKTFTIVEERVGPLVRQLGDEILLENLTEEVRAVTASDNDFDLWRQAVDPSVATPPLDKDKCPSLLCSCDMAWQQKKSGHSYDSPSGHALMFGHHTRKPLMLCIKSRLCSFCTHFNKKNPGVNVPRHDCLKNHEGTSGAMEAAACLELLTRMHDNFHCGVAMLCCDDDSLVRADCQWNNADYLKNYNKTTLPQAKITRGPNKGDNQDQPDKGKLRGDIPESSFVGDPNH